MGYTRNAEAYAELKAERFSIYLEEHEIDTTAPDYDEALWYREFEATDYWSWEW